MVSGNVEIKIQFIIPVALLPHTDVSPCQVSDLLLPIWWLFKRLPLWLFLHSDRIPVFSFLAAAFMTS